MLTFLAGGRVLTALRGLGLLPALRHTFTLGAGAGDFGPRLARPALVPACLIILVGEFGGGIDSRIRRGPDLAGDGFDARVSRLPGGTSLRRRVAFILLPGSTLSGSSPPRLRHELEREQANLEAIGLRALELAEDAAASHQAREIDDDWMFAFARHAQAFADKDIQELWARVLNAAASDGKQKLSAVSLQTLTLVDSRLAADFRNFCAAVNAFGFCPAHDGAFDPETETQKIDLLGLLELGLVREDPLSGSYPFKTFELRIGSLPGKRIDLLHTSFSLSRRGAEIANAVFQDEDLALPDAVRKQYLEDVVARQMNEYISMTITPPPHPGEVISPFAVSLTHKRGPAPVKRDLTPIEAQLSEEARQLIDWASRRYDISLTNTMSGSGAIGPPGPFS